MNPMLTIGEESPPPTPIPGREAENDIPKGKGTGFKKQRDLKGVDRGNPSGNKAANTETAPLPAAACQRAKQSQPGLDTKQDLSSPSSRPNALCCHPPACPPTRNQPPRPPGLWHRPFPCVCLRTHVPLFEVPPPQLGAAFDIQGPSQIGTTHCFRTRSAPLG